RIPRALGVSRALIMAPTYSDYADACANNGVEVEYLVTEAAANFVPDMDLLRDRAKGVDGVFFCNPNNPTGVYTPVEEIEVVARDCPEATFIVDESYLPFVDGYGDHGMAERGLPNVVAMHSLSKMFCIPGLRIGLCHAPRRIAERLREYAEPWSVNTLAQEAVRFITGNPDLAAEHVRRTREYLVAEHAAFAEAFADARDITAYPGTATFVLFGLAAGTAAELVGDMLRERFLLRDCANFHGLSDGYFRVAFKSGDANRNIARLIARWAAGRSRVA
ncbi:MAG: aminotransferase class I/II-fold pyridoxal phosphate-dependent enzyme, partial [Desulfatibacillaceae bacterium]